MSFNVNTSPTILFDCYSPRLPLAVSSPCPLDEAAYRLAVSYSMMYLIICQYMLTSSFSIFRPLKNFVNLFFFVKNE